MGSEPKKNKPTGSEPIACPWCAGEMKPAAQGRYKADPEDGPDAWAACLVCLSCAAASPWGKGDTQAEAIQAAEHKARGLLQRMAAPPAEGRRMTRPWLPRAVAGAGMGAMLGAALGREVGLVVGAVVGSILGVLA